MKIQKYLLILVVAVISSSLASMHHEKSNNFSDCEGQVGNLYVSEILKSGTIEGFKKAVGLHQKFYTDRGFDVRVIPAAEYERNENTTIEKPYRLSTIVLFPSLEIRELWSNREFSEQDQKEFNAFLDLYNENNKVVVRRSICYLD